MSEHVIKTNDSILLQTGDSTYLEVDYETLVETLVKADKRKRVQLGTKFSRQCSLACHAYTKGIWTTGGVIDKTAVLRNLTKAFNTLDVKDYKRITPNGMKCLSVLSKLDAGMYLIYRKVQEIV